MADPAPQDPAGDVAAPATQMVFSPELAVEFWNHIMFADEVEVPEL